MQEIELIKFEYATQIKQLADVHDSPNSGQIVFNYICNHYF